MALKDYTDGFNQCIANNHDEFVEILLWLLDNGGETMGGKNKSAFESVHSILDVLKVKYEDYSIESDDEDECCLIGWEDREELNEFLLKNINDNTLVPSEDEYPVLTQWCFEDDFDRIGTCNKEMFITTSLAGIKNVNEYIADFKKT